MKATKHQYLLALFIQLHMYPLEYVQKLQYTLPKLKHEVDEVEDLPLFID